MITGASGLIGTRITEMLLEEGHGVSHLGRSKRPGKVPSFIWDVKKKNIDGEALHDVDTIIHLAGANVGDKRWSAEWKKEIRDSRVQSTQLLYEMLAKGDHAVKTVVAASAIGFYGFVDGDQMMKEDHEPGNDFLATVVHEWEKEADKIASLGIRVVKIRIGIVLSERGGALQEMAKPIRYFVGSPLGSGRQYISWIHLDDICQMFILACKNSGMRGVYNGVAPHPVTNRELTKKIASVIKRPLLLPAIPGFALKLILGEMADVVIHGSKVSPDKIVQSGFEFQFDDLDAALHDLLDDH